jgi:hypothetical protein
VRKNCLLPQRPGRFFLMYFEDDYFHEFCTLPSEIRKAQSNSSLYRPDFGRYSHTVDCTFKISEGTVGFFHFLSSFSHHFLHFLFKEKKRSACCVFSLFKSTSSKILLFVPKVEFADINFFFLAKLK